MACIELQNFIIVYIMPCFGSLVPETSDDVLFPLLATVFVAKNEKSLISLWAVSFISKKNLTIMANNIYL